MRHSSIMRRRDSKVGNALYPAPDPFGVVSAIRANILIDNALALLSGRRILDFGCGSGIVALALARRARAFVTMADVADYRQVESDLKFHLVPPNGRLPFAPDSFDAVTLVEMLHHAGNPLAVVHQALIVAPLVVIFESEPSPPVRIYDVISGILRHASMMPCRPKPSRHWRTQFETMGWAVEERLVRSPWWYPARHALLLVSRKASLGTGITPKNQV